MVIAANASTQFTRLIAGSITLTFFTYIFVNIGMVIGFCQWWAYPAADQLRRHIDGDNAAGIWYFDEHTDASQTGKDLKTVRRICSSRA